MHEQLLEARGAAMSSEELLARAWDEAADPFSNVVKGDDQPVAPQVGEPPIIETVPGAGCASCRASRLKSR